MAIPMDKDGPTKKDKQSKSKYHLDDSERKLPRPVVFWSDNEKDAFRRNKVVQTRYYMLLDDIETQKKSSEKTIRHEAHKFRRRYKADIVCGSDNSSSVSGLSDLSSFRENSSKRELRFKSLPATDMETDAEINEIPKKGMITKIKKSSVKFAGSSEVIDDDNSEIEHVSIASKLGNHTRKIRSQSAVQGRDREPCSTTNNRVKSAMVKTGHSSFGREDRPSSCKTLSSQSTTSQKKMKPNSIFFDKSQASYQLRKELQKLAKSRKTGIVKVAYTMEDAIRDERDKLVESTKKVAEYIERLEIDKQNRKISEWTSKSIEPVF